MAGPRLFKLKSQVAPAIDRPLATHLPIAQIWVNSGIFHLDQLYDYAVPQLLSEQVQTGVRVQVPFNSREVEGLVLRRAPVTSRSGAIRSITRVLSSIPVATESSLQLITTVAKGWAGNTWDLIRSAIPPRVASVERGYIRIVDGDASQESAKQFIFTQLIPHSDPELQVAQSAIKALARGSVLLIAPNEALTQSIAQHLQALDPTIPILHLESGAGRGERYKNFLIAMNPGPHIVIGARAAIFAPVGNLRSIIIHRESSSDYFELRAPAWNVRDVAVIRHEREDVSLLFTGFVPSLDIAALIDAERISYINQRLELSVRAFPSLDGALLPSRIFSPIRRALKLGPVLFIAPRKGYGHLACAKCKNGALCDCGGRLGVISKSSDPSCFQCGKVYADWKCKWCGESRQYLAARGIERAGEEIGRAFPGYPVIVSAGGSIHRKVSGAPALVLSTPGALPKSATGYSAVVILEGLTFFSHSDLRGDERARELFFESAGAVASGGEVLLCIDENHPIVPALARWSPAILLKRELAVRRDLNLTPYSKSALLICESREVTQLLDGLQRSIQEGRLPQSVRVLGPSSLGEASAKLVLTSNSEDFQKVVEFLHELSRRRSMAQKSPFTIRVEPYSL